MKEQTRPEKLQQFEALCRRRGIPLTWQRRAVLEALAERRDHPTADQLYEAVSARVPGISRTTVYRALETLQQVGVARRVLHPGSATRFDAVTEHHHHVVCLRCGLVLDVAEPVSESLDLPSEVPGGFEIVDYSIYFQGICSACRQQAAERGGSDHLSD